MFKSLRARIIAILLVLTLSLMIVIGTVLVNSVTSFYHNDFTRQMESVFDTDMLNRLSHAQDSDALSDILSAFSRRLGVDSYRNYYILDQNAHYVDGTNEELGKSLSKTENLLAALAGKTGAQSNRHGAMDYAISVTASDGQPYIIYIRDTMEEASELTVVMITIIVQTLLAVLLIALLLSFFLARTITNPVESLTVGAQKIASGDFSHELAIYSDDEIGELTATFNEMAGVLKNTLDEVNLERNKLETIFLYLTDGVVAFDQKGSLLHVNKAAKELFPENWFEERSSFQQIFGFAHVSLPFEELLQLQQKKNVMVTAKAGNKALTIYFASLIAGSKQASPIGLIAVIHDITEQERLENSRKEFIANVSHELRTPLTNIKSYTETVLDNESLALADRNRFLTIAMNETDRMSRIVQDLAALSRLDNQKETWSVSTFRVDDLVERACDAMMMEVKKHRDHLSVSYQNPLPEISGDKDKIEQVLVNILSNAIKYTQDGGTISLSVYTDDDVFIQVTDNGFGIPKEDVPHLFERFYRVDKARSREKGGSGLGLAIAQEIIRYHGGDITIESELEKGTTATIRLPIHCKLSPGQH